MIDFELEPQVIERLKMYHMVAENVMRPISREYDEREHEDPDQFFQTMWQAQSLADVAPGGDKKTKRRMARATRSLPRPSFEIC